MAYQLKEINERVRGDVTGFLEECDARYQERVDHAARVILERMKDSPIVLLSGPSGSGKTTSAKKLEETLEKQGVNTHTISMDNYFHTLDREKAPRTPEGDIDFESPLCMDMELMDTHFTLLAKGEEVMIPHFEFSRQMRNDCRATPLKLGKNEIAIFEGIHALNDHITGHHPKATKLYISARSTVNEGDAVRFKGTWLRLVRRAVRDHQFRGTGVGETLAMWANVRRGEKLYISPFKDRANVTIDSALPYEVSVMKNFALPLLSAIPEENARRTELLELMDSFRLFEAIDPALVRPDSLLREFIGGGSYHY